VPAAVSHMFRTNSGRSEEDEGMNYETGKGGCFPWSLARVDPLK
jgi:hypothetical protein